MSQDPFDDLPDQIREAIKEMMRRFQKLNPEELETMMNQVFGDDFMEKLRDISFAGGSFSFPLDPKIAKNFEVLMKDIMGNNPSTFSQEFDSITEEEPYYEVTPPVSGEGQIVVDMPGITDVRQVKWDRREGEIEVFAESHDTKYLVVIPLSQEYLIKDIFAEVKNSVFILPYSDDSV